MLHVRGALVAQETITELVAEYTVHVSRAPLHSLIGQAFITPGGERLVLRDLVGEITLEKLRE